MKNLLFEKPNSVLHGRLKYSLAFIDKKDLRERRLLNIGCGFGWFEKAIIKYLPESLTSTEISDQDLLPLRSSIFAKKIKTVVADGTKLPFPDSCFDTVFSWEVLEHIPRGKDNLFLQEVARVLKPGGIFYFSTPHDSLLSKICDPAWWILNHRHYSIRQIIYLARTADFCILDISVRGRVWDLIMAFNLYFSKWILRRPILCAGFFYQKTDHEYQTEGFNDIFVKLKKC